MKKHILYILLVVGLFSQPAKAQLSWQQAADGLSISSLDPDYTKWFNAVVAAGGTLTATQQKATNTLVINAKSHGWWYTDTAIYIGIGGSAAACKFNVKRPQDADASYRLTFTTGWTFSTSTGAKPDGASTTYADTHLVPNSVLSQNSTSVSFYSKGNISATQVEIGATSAAGNPPQDVLEINTSGITYLTLSAGGTYTQYSDANSLGYYVGSRTASNAIASYKNAVSKATGTTASTGQATRNLYIAAFNNTGTMFNSTKNWIFIDIGGGKSSSDVTTQSADVNGWATTLGINEY